MHIPAVKWIMGVLGSLLVALTLGWAGSVQGDINRIDAHVAKGDITTTQQLTKITTTLEYLHEDVKELKATLKQHVEDSRDGR